jgi:hypothetical protein
VANQNYVELERAESGEKMAASVEVVDYEANLALLQPQDKKFLDGSLLWNSRTTRLSGSSCRSPTRTNRSLWS